MTNMEAIMNAAPDWAKIGVELDAAYAARHAVWDAVLAAGAMGSDAADEADELFWRIVEMINETPATTPEGAVKARAMRSVFAEELKGGAAKAAMALAPGRSRRERECRLTAPPSCGRHGWNGATPGAGAGKNTGSRKIREAQRRRLAEDPALNQTNP